MLHSEFKVLPPNTKGINTYEGGFFSLIVLTGIQLSLCNYIVVFIDIFTAWSIKTQLILTKEDCLLLRGEGNSITGLNSR